MPGNISAPSLMAGEIQFGQMTGALMSPIRLQGGDPVMLVSVQELLDDRLVVRPNIKTPEDLKGKRIAISRFGAASHMRVLNILPRYGLSEKDVTFLQIGDTPARIIAMIGNAVDASSFSPPDHLAAQQAGMRILLNMAELNIFYQGTGFGRDATLHREKSRPGQAHGEELRRSDPSRQNQPRSHQAGVRQIPQDQRREATRRRLSNPARNGKSKTLSQPGKLQDHLQRRERPHTRCQDGQSRKNSSTSAFSKSWINPAISTAFTDKKKRRQDILSCRRCIAESVKFKIAPHSNCPAVFSFAR